MDTEDTAFMSDKELHRLKLSDDAYRDRLDKKMREIAEGSDMADIVIDHADSLAHILGSLVINYDQDQAFELHRYLNALVCGIAKREIPDFLASDEEEDLPVFLRKQAD